MSPLKVEAGDLIIIQIPEKARKEEELPWMGRVEKVTAAKVWFWWLTIESNTNLLLPELVHPAKDNISRKNILAKFKMDLSKKINPSLIKELKTISGI